MAKILIDTFTAILMVDGFMTGIQIQPGNLKKPSQCISGSLSAPFQTISGLFLTNFGCYRL